MWATVAVGRADGSGTPRWWRPSPLLIFQIFTNFDALARRGRGRRAAGVVAAKTGGWPGRSSGSAWRSSCYPLLLLVPLVILGVRTGRVREVGKTAIAAVLTWLAVNLPIMVMFPRGLVGVLPAQHPSRRRHGLPLQRGEVLHRLGRVRPEPRLLGAADGAQHGAPRCLFAVCCARSLTSRLTRQAPAPAGAAGVPGAWRPFLLTNKVWSPQFSLWLVPLAALALPHRRILLAWMTIDALVWIPRMLYLYGEQNMGLPEQWFTTTVLLPRYRGDRPVRAGGSADLPAGAGSGPRARHGRVDDPSGGVFDRAPDAVPVLVARPAAASKRAATRQPAEREAVLTT